MCDRAGFLFSLVNSFPEQLWETGCFVSRSLQKGIDGLRVDENIDTTDIDISSVIPPDVLRNNVVGVERDQIQLGKFSCNVTKCNAPCLVPRASLSIDLSSAAGIIC